ncbi:hypothetical protein BDN70DRAFT_879790 [Pholiota conissans]|uniref:Meiotic sister chromatid recombination protein 1 n=1 Tax=Pholiota conissans TaxID=109636 RepID=A0A9P5YZG4_9AGAR|nr:hypothetical protein BDN70DRAFT_879790 [Pholiota conissans]
MRPSLFLVAASLTLAAQASWFSDSSANTPEYAKWNTNELKAWLEVHNVPLPDHKPTQAELRNLVESNWNTARVWSQDQYASAQKAFADLRDTAFDSWDESRLREFLLQNGIVAPKGPKEHLVLLAQQKYRSYHSAASSFSARASETASTAIYGDSKHQASKSASSLVTHATEAVTHAADDVTRKFDESKDYVYSTWSDNQMRKYLEEKGVLKTKTQKKRDELIKMMHDAYGSVADPIWDAWSDSYMHHWLVSRHLIKSDYEKKRDALIKPMQQYYYSANDKVWHTWSDTDAKAWLVEHGVIRSDAQVSRDKMSKMFHDNYISAKDTFWSAWSDNAIREWLIENGHMRSDAQYKRDELIKLANEKWSDEKAKLAEYLTWPDARLRAFLRQSGIPEEHLPTSRPGLLQETRIRWVQAHGRAENIFAKIKELVNSGIYKADEVLTKIMNLLKGDLDDGLTSLKSTEAYDAATHKAEQAKAGVKDGKANAEDWVGEKVESAGDKVKTAGRKLQGEL